jgi:hypothetical protein
MGIFFFSLRRRRVHGSFDAIVLCTRPSKVEKNQPNLANSIIFQWIGPSHKLVIRRTWAPEQLALLQQPDYVPLSSKLTRICYGKRKRNPVLRR